MGKILLFYKYVNICNPHEIADFQREICERLSLKGRILIADEGINGTVGGSIESILAYKNIMLQDPLFCDIDFKESEGDSYYFPKLKVKVKKEIVNLGLDKQIYNADNGGIHLDPKEVHNLLNNKPEDLVILDTRNNYEWAIGTFNDAILPDIKNFRDLPEYISSSLDQFKDKQVLMFCTGGVRCERATSYLKSFNVAKSISQIKGGIHRYIEQYPEGHFRGKNYVFDGRIAVKVNDDILSSCFICSIKYDEYTNCFNAKCNKHIVACPACINKYNNTCGQECFDLVNSKSVNVRTIPACAIKNKSELIVLQDYPLDAKNWFKTGGNAKYYISPSNESEFISAFDFAKKNELDFFILGDGANILISDEGFNGLVIKPSLNKISKFNLDANHVGVTAQAGVIFADLINWCLDNGFIGLEEFSGIPGTVGGSVFINIHYFEFLLSNFLLKARVIDIHNGNILNVDNKWFEFGYNYSKLHDKRYCLLDATFKLKIVEGVVAAYNKGRSAEMIRHRRQRYPYQNTCGSFFRNFYENEVTLESNGKKMIYAAYYLDKVGVKGQLKVGKACVSYQHANMIVTTDGAISNDIINLARAMQQVVYDEFGIILKPECRLIGFKKYPLL